MPRRRYARPLRERFEAQVERTDSCWIWRGSVTRAGYGLIASGFPRHKNIGAHRASYELFVGEIPEGYEIDHLCRTPLCVNPFHLEAVTRRENQHRSPLTFAGIHSIKTHCPQGHPYDDTNTRINHRGARVCKTCCREDARRRRAA